MSLSVDGGVHFPGHDYGDGAILDNEPTDFRLELEGTSAVSYAELHYREFIGTQTVGDWITKPDSALGEWTLTAPLEPGANEMEFAPIEGSVTTADCDGDTGNGDGGDGTPSEDTSSDLAASFDDVSSGEDLSGAEEGQGLYSISASRRG